MLTLSKWKHNSGSAKYVVPNAVIFVCVYINLPISPSFDMLKCFQSHTCGSATPQTTAQEMFMNLCLPITKKKWCSWFTSWEAIMFNVYEQHSQNEACKQNPIVLWNRISTSVLSKKTYNVSPCILHLPAISVKPTKKREERAVCAAT